MKSTASVLSPQSSVPSLPKPTPGHICVRGGISHKTREHCQHCLSADTIRLAGDLKKALTNPMAPHLSCPARSALRQTLPPIRRILENAA